MAKKIDIEIVQMVLKRARLTAVQQAQILEDIKFESNQTAVEDREPPVKKQFVVIINDPYGRFEEAGVEFSGWVVQIPEDEDPHSARRKLFGGAYDFNRTPKGRKMPLRTIDEAVRFGSAKIYKEHKIWLKHKEPVLIIPADGRIVDIEKL